MDRMKSHTITPRTAIVGLQDEWLGDYCNDLRIN